MPRAKHAGKMLARVQASWPDRRAPAHIPHPALVAALLVPLGLALSACEVGRSYERMADGSIQYLISPARWKRQKLATGSCGPSTGGWKPMSCRSVTNSSIRFRDYDLLRDLSRTDLAISLPRS